MHRRSQSLQSGLLLLQLLSASTQFQLLPLDRHRLLHGLHKSRALTKIGYLILESRHPSLQLRGLLVQKSQTLC